MSLKYWNVLSTSLADRFFSKQLAFQCAQFALPFLYGYDTEFIQELLKVGKKHLGQKFDFTDRYIDDILFLNNLKISEFIDLIYLYEFEIENKTESNTSASILTMERLLLGFMTRGTTLIFQ